ncbi:hypothetical protein CAN33_0055040 [Aspergillus niger]|uniref:Major Facilitator Superfamily protein n=1 Tax=Aspergillus niger TaxID=5061 RepID=A0A254U4S5_ASPNG|nr:hypothetical protein CBS12448_11107 [Aspergillus niger]KAI2866552.1 hypothetical protein CBS11852_11493 [Aspergillus niger]KAI2982995.1 hypothetical protein CBS147345_11169 [Aspergillus niger]KAI3014407.1 hypothetical protein CBS147347_11499 [Aspergillus niger]KAI3057594.1 hypothetical protein CBS147353_10928 [Aspergillus niger]
MNTQSLLHYLSIGLPTIPKQGTNPGPNTTNPQYDADDITQIVPWPEFDYSVIIQRYGELLNSTQIRPDPFTSPPAPLRDEPTFHLRFSDLVMNRVRRGLRAGFEQLAPELQTRQLSVITIDGGGSARIIDQFRPDAAFIVVGASLTTGVNRAPGDLKVSWKWRSSMRSSQDLADQREYKQVLAQVNFYMEQHNARHGFILSDAELVAVKRLDGNGRLAVATSIPWASGGAGRLSVLLGLWYLGMLAAENNNWSLH